VRGGPGGKWKWSVRSLEGKCWRMLAGGLDPAKGDCMARPGEGSICGLYTYRGVDPSLRKRTEEEVRILAPLEILHLKVVTNVREKLSSRFFQESRTNESEPGGRMSHLVLGSTSRTGVCVGSKRNKKKARVWHVGRAKTAYL